MTPWKHINSKTLKHPNLNIDNEMSKPAKCDVVVDKL